MSDEPLIEHVYRETATGEHHLVVGLYLHPKWRPYHVKWNGRYVIYQKYGNFSNEMKMMLLDEFVPSHVLAWEPLKVCKFCGFARMRPCTTRQTCANLSDYRLEPDEADYEEPAR